MDLVILDFAKAFDRVPHRRLLGKLDHYGIRGSTHKWITSFLRQRTQQVIVDGATSENRVLTRILKIGVRMLFARKNWSFTILFLLALLKKLESESKS